MNCLIWLVGNLQYIIIIIALLCSGAQLSFGQTQSQVGASISRQWILANYQHEQSTVIGGLGTGIFFHHQFKGKNRSHSNFGVVTALDYMGFRQTIPYRGIDLYPGFAPNEVEMEIDVFTFRAGAAVNLNASRAQRLQVYFQFGYLFYYEQRVSSVLLYADGRRVESSAKGLFGAERSRLHNLYASLDFRYQLGSRNFVGLSGQFSTLNLASERPGQPLSLGAGITFGHFLREEDEIEKKKRRELVPGF